MFILLIYGMCKLKYDKIVPVITIPIQIILISTVDSQPVVLRYTAYPPAVPNVSLGCLWLLYIQYIHHTIAIDVAKLCCIFIKFHLKTTLTKYKIFRYSSLSKTKWPPILPGAHLPTCQ